MVSNVQCEPVPDLRGKAATAAVLSLDAIGPQEQYLNNSDSYFIPSFERSAQNAIFQRESQFGQPSTTYFGNTVKHVFNTKEMGDLLANMYLKTRMPILSENQESSNVVIEFPNDFDVGVAAGEEKCIENSELLRVQISGSNISPQTDLVGFLDNRIVSNILYTGNTDMINNVAVGRVVIEGHTLGTKLITNEKITEIKDFSGEMSINVFMSVNETNVQNPDTIDGGIRKFEFSNFARATKYDALLQGSTFSYKNSKILSLNDLDLTINLAGVSETLPYANTSGSLFGDNNIAVTSVASNIGTKFIFSNVNFEINSDLSFYTNVYRTPDNISLDTLSTHTFASNAMVSNVIIDGNQSIPDGANMLTVGNDFNIIYNSEGYFPSAFGGANVVQSTPGLLNSNVTIVESDDRLASYINEDDFAFHRKLLYKVDYNASPSSETLVNIDDIEPVAGVLGFYSNATNHYIPSELNNIEYLEEVTTPPGTYFKEVYMQGISTNPNDYVLDGSILPVVSITSPARNTTITLGYVLQGNTNDFLLTVINFRQELPTFVNVTGYTDNRPFVRYYDPAQANNKFSIGQGHVETQEGDEYYSGTRLYSAYQHWAQSPTPQSCRVTMGGNVLPNSPSLTDGIENDPDFIHAMRYGGLIISKLSENVSNVSVRVSKPTLDMYVGTTRHELMEMYSNTTVISYSLNKDIQVTNEANTYTNNLATLGISDSDTTKILQGAANHVTLQSNVLDRTICPSINGNTDEGNIYTIYSRYTVDSFEKTSNGYANVLTNGSEYGPIPIQNEELVINFFSNTVTGYSNVAHIYNNYYDLTLGRPDVLFETMTSIIDPFMSNVSSDVNGNMYIDKVDNNLEVPGILLMDERRFGESGYDIFWDLQWEGSNIMTIKTYDGAFDNRTVLNIDSNVLTYDVSDASSLYFNVPSFGESLVHMSATGEQTLNGYPLSLVSVVLTTGNNVPISYDTSNVYYQKAELVMPREFNNTATFDYFLDLGSSTTFYSGPTVVSANTLLISNITTTSEYSTNVDYTYASTNVFIGPTQDVANVITSTWDPKVTIELFSYSNILTITNSDGVSDSYSIPPESSDAYGKILRNSNIEFNPLLDYGEANTSPLTSGGDRFLSNAAFFDYLTNVYVIGGITGNEFTNKSFKASSDGGLTSNTITQIPFEFAFRDARAIYNPNNKNAYLFAPIDSSRTISNAKKLFRGEFNDEIHSITAWELESPSFPGDPVEMPSIAYVSDKIVVLGGKELSSDKIDHNYAYYYNTISRSWNTVTLTNPIYTFGTNGTLAVGSNVYFWNGASASGHTDFSKISYVNTDDNYSVSDVSNDPGISNALVTYSTINFNYSPSESRIYIVGGYKGESNVQYINTLTNIRYTENYTNVTTPIDTKLVNFVSYYDTYFNSRIIFYAGIDDGVQTATINYYNTILNEWIFTGLDMLFPKNLYNAPFIGNQSPGNIPLIYSGIRIASQKTPMFTITDDVSSNVLEFGLKRSNIFTASANTTIENKGIFANWYVNTKDSVGAISNIGWEGKDYNLNFGQDGLTVGPPWLGDALNNPLAIANTYTSNIIFASSSNIQNTYMTFKTDLDVSSPPNQRADIVTSNIESIDITYSNVSFMNNLLSYYVNGVVPVNYTGNSVICIENKFNPFSTGVFIENPEITATFSTDNTPNETWYFSESGGIITPPGNPPDTSNTVVKDVYRQYLPSKLNRSGRLDKIEFFYGDSRYTRPRSGFQLSNTFEFGVFRDDAYTGAPMLPRKMTIASFVPPGMETNSNAHIEIYKYFASNVGYAQSEYNTERGWYDEVIVSFGPEITQSGIKEIITLNPGYGTAEVGIGTSAPLSNALQASDTIEILFTDYNTNDLSVTSNIIYNSSIVTRQEHASKVVKLKSVMFNALYDTTGRSGDVIIFTPFNNGLVTSNVDYGVRPISGVNVSDQDFSSNLLRTSLSTMIKLDPTNPSGYSNTVVQENVYSTLFPIKVHMNKYNPNGIYTDKIGRAIIDEITFDIGGQEIETLDDMWYVMRDELFRTDDEKNALKFLINGGEDYLPTSKYNYGPIDLYIPLDLFFCRSRKTSSTQIKPKKVYDEYRSQKPYLPLCALKDQDITVTIKFNPQTYFSNTTSAIDLSYLDTYLITEEIYISPDEKNFFKNTPQTIAIENIHKLPKQLFFEGNDQRYEGLVMDLPLKMINWAFRSAQFENKNDYTEFLHRYNFSTIRTENDRYKLYYELLKQAKFFLEGTPLVERYGTSDFYKYYQGLNSDLTATEKNIYTYAFSMYPSKMDPSGNINLSTSASNKTFLSFDLEIKEASTTLEIVDPTFGFTLHTYGYGYNVLRIEDGRATLAFF